MTPVRWLDSYNVPNNIQEPGMRRSLTQWIRSIPFIGMHVMCLGVIWVGWSWPAVAVCVALYAVRMFAITGFYHRYFSHRTFKTHRWSQFLFAVLGNSAVQRGPLWWAAHHRHHHMHSDQEHDVHSPRQHGFLWSHVGWVTSPHSFLTNLKAVPDLARFPELRFLDRFDTLVPIVLGVVLYLVGVLLARFAPGLGTNGMQMLIWGFFVSTVILAHATFTINSLSHKMGTRRFHTKDDSRNSLLLALLTFGEGWHNNHHHFPSSARQGFYWWEIDLTYYVLKMMSWVGLVWDLKPVPKHVLDRNLEEERLEAERQEHPAKA
ncbi:MAG: acyl-CoA desaturase [Planctomycetia bacterium]